MLGEKGGGGRGMSGEGWICLDNALSDDWEGGAEFGGRLFCRVCWLIFAEYSWAFCGKLGKEASIEHGGAVSVCCGDCL